MDQNWLNNKTVIVTGASSGMGKGITEKAARLSWPTVFITWRNRCSCVRFIPV